MRLMPGQRDDPQVLSRLLVPPAKLGLIRLDSIARLERGLGPSRIDRFNRQFGSASTATWPPATRWARPPRPYAGSSTRWICPPATDVLFSGQVKILEETTTNMMLAIGLASIFMYMVLAAQFESLVHPFIIMLTLPLSIPVRPDLADRHGPLAQPVQRAGSPAAAGHRQEERNSADRLHEPPARERASLCEEAILEANRIRLRPILMTTFSIIAGLIPTAVGIGAGAATRSAIAVTIIGGQTLCLLLTLLVVPVGYA